MIIFKELRFVLFVTVSCLCQALASEDFWQNKKCKWDAEDSFSENIHCILDRHRRQTRPNYDNYGHPCTSYARLHQTGRRVGNRINHMTDSALCDRTLKRRWYRFEGPAGGTMPETCVEEFNCGTHAPIWLNGRHPDFYGEVLDIQACVSLSGDCCERTWYIRVANCGDFFTYLLTDTPGCFMAYCAGEQVPCPAGQSSITGFSPGCSDDFPHFDGGVALHVGEQGSEINMYCDYEGPIPVGSIIDTEWFVAPGDDETGEDGKFPVFVEPIRGRRRSILQEGHWAGKMGSTIHCRMRARWANRTGVPSPYIESESYFAGIKISKRVVEVSESDAEAVIQIQSTVPVTCLPQFKDVCKVTVELAHDPEVGGKRCVDGKIEQVVFGDCSIDITPSNWREPHNVSVKAVRDFYNDGTKNMRVGFKPVYSTLASEHWNDYELPAVEVIAKDVHNALCSSTGDPHYHTFDNFYYHVYLEGEFVLYKNTRIPVQINTRLEECGKTVSCNCAVAVKAGDDVIVIDRCKRRNRNLAYGSSFPEGWSSLHRHALEQGDSFVDGLKLYEYDGGRRYTVHLPTGAYVDFKVGEHWINIYLYGSSDDWRSTLGLCGTFDGDRTNDLTFPDGYTTVEAVPYEACGDSERICKFAEQWRVPKEESFFGEIVEVPVEEHEFFSDRKYCKCEKKNGKSEVVCNYHYDVHNCQGEQLKQYGSDKTEDVKIRSRSSRHTRSISKKWSDDVTDYFNSDFIYNETFKGQVPTWPTPTGITESYAHTYCSNLITRSRVSHVCNTIIQDKVHIIIDECMTDIKVTGDLTWGLASLTTLTEQCRSNIHQNAQFWEDNSASGDDGQEEEMYNTQGDTMLTEICPGDCSQRGTCYQGSCHCSYGYEGDDCSTSIFKQPQIQLLAEDGYCDIHSRPCKKVKVYGKDFRNTTDLKCHFRNSNDEVTTIPAHFITFEELDCPLPQQEVTIADKTMHIGMATYTLFLTENGFRSNNKPVVVHDSRCYTCEPANDQFECKQQPSSCLIANICYGHDDRNPANCCERCNPDSSTNSFTAVTELRPITLYPRQTNHSVVSGDTWKMNFRAFGGSGCKFQYSATDTTGSFIYSNGPRDLRVEFPSSAPGYFTLDVSVIESCGEGLVSRYGVAVLPRPSPVVPLEIQRNCPENISPYFEENSKSFTLLEDGVLEVVLHAIDPDVAESIEYYVIKRTSNYVSMSVDGKLRYHHSDPSVHEDKLTVLAMDSCNAKAYLPVSINIIPCPCENGGSCTKTSGTQSGSGEYTCLCSEGFSGDVCEFMLG